MDSNGGGDVRYWRVGREINVVNFEDVVLGVGAELLDVDCQWLYLGEKARLDAYVQWVLAGDGVFRLGDESILLAADCEERSR